MRLRVVKKQCEAFEMSGRTVGLDLLQLRSAIPNLPDMHRSIQIHPVVGARKRMQEEAGMDLPCPNVEIEIMLPVPQLAGRWLHGRCCHSLGECAHRKEAADEQALKKNCSGLPSRIH